jgi:hypothetical protein
MYIPKNKIKTNLIAGPNQLVDINGNGYVGSYYKLSTGRIQSGKFPGDGKNIDLFEVGSLTPPELKAPALPTPSNTTNILPLHPTPKDYEYGSFIRYFSKKRNEYLFKEISQTEYNTLNENATRLFDLYKPFYIKWMLTGNVTTVSDFNRYSILSTEEKEKVYGLNEFLKMNYTQYYK